MNSLISSDKKYIGQYLCIQDNDFSVRMFAKFYNLSIQNNNFTIDINRARNLIRMNKYKLHNKIYVNDLNSNNDVLKSIKPGSYMVYINDTKKLYILNKEEFDRFIYTNEYIRIKSSNFVLGIDDGLYFKNVKIIVASSLDTAKLIYRERYNIEENPICIGIEEDNRLNIYTDNTLISTAFEPDDKFLINV